MRRFALLLLTALACGGDPASPMEIHGTYDITSREGVSVPAPVNFTAGALTISSITGGYVLLIGQGQHTTRLDFVATTTGGTGPGAAVFANLLPFTSSGNSLALTLSDGRTVTGTLGGPRRARTLTVPLGAPWGTFVFTKTQPS